MRLIHGQLGLNNLQSITMFRLSVNHSMMLYRKNALYSFIPKNACSTLRLSTAIENGCIDGIEQGHYLFIARHWSSCVESLLHRHSRDLAFSLPALNNHAVAFKFWLDPSLAASMWLAYNKRLLAFAKQHPEKTIVVTQRALFDGAPLIKIINEQFGFKLNEQITSPFDPALFRDKANQRIFSSLSFALQAQLNSVWS